MPVHRCEKIAAGHYIKRYTVKLSGVWRTVCDTFCPKCGKPMNGTRVDHLLEMGRKGKIVHCMNCASRRTRSKKINFPEPKKDFWIYLAGFLDGEGCLSKSGSSSYTLSVAQVDKTVLDYISENIPTCVIAKKTHSHPNHNDCYFLRTTNHYVIGWILKNIGDYLIVKKYWIKIFNEYSKRRVA